MEFPRLVFKDHGPHQRPGGSYDHAPVESQEDFDAALKAGCCISPCSSQPALCSANDSNKNNDKRSMRTLG